MTTMTTMTKKKEEKEEVNDLLFPYRFDLQSRENKKDKVQGEVHLILHFKVDKTKLPGKMEIEAQYDAVLAAQVYFSLFNSHNI
jgi:hypothetical protein